MQNTTPKCLQVKADALPYPFYYTETVEVQNGRGCCSVGRGHGSYGDSSPAFSPPGWNEHLTDGVKVPKDRQPILLTAIRGHVRVKDSQDDRYIRISNVCPDVGNGDYPMNTYILYSTETQQK